MQPVPKTHGKGGRSTGKALGSGFHDDVICEGFDDVREFQRKAQEYHPFLRLPLPNDFMPRGRFTLGVCRVPDQWLSPRRLLPPELVRAFADRTAYPFPAVSNFIERTRFGRKTRPCAAVGAKACRLVP